MPISKRPEKLAWVALIVSLVFLIAAILMGKTSGSHILHLSIVPFALTTVFSFVAWWHGFLMRREQEESAEHDRIEREYADRADLFEDESEELKLAQDARLTFDRWFVTSFSVICGLIVTGLSIYFIVTWGATETYLTLEDRYLSYAGIGAFMVLFSLLLGSYFNGLSREPGCRWLRPVGSWTLFGALVQILGVLGMLARHYEIGLKDAQPHELGAWDMGLARLLLVVLIILGLELITNVILEFYRPRVEGEEPKPLYESRLLGFVTEPGSVAQNVANALDYQFGITVSQTWFYRFLERHLIRLVVVMVIGLYLMDCFTMVNADQRGIRETYMPGSTMTKTVIGPGFYLKLPRPFQHVRKYQVDRIHRVEIGHAGAGDGDSPEDHHEGPEAEVPEEMQGDPTGKIIVWNKTHFAKEDRFIVATHRDHDADGAEVSEAVPVSFVALGVTVDYKIKDDPDGASLMDYAYNYENPSQVLQRLAQREVVGFLATHDLFDILGAGMEQTRDDLSDRIAAAVAAQQPALGVDVLFVGLSGVHPPPEVAEAYQQVVGAPEGAAAARLQAEGFLFERENDARSQASRIIQQAQSHRQSTIADAEGDANLFRENIVAWKAAPGVFKARRQLDGIEEYTRGSRMFFIASESEEIYILNLEEKPTLDLLDQLEINE